MASFKSTIITQKGHNLMAKLSAGTATMSFTKIKSSDHDYSALTSSQLEALVSIDNIKQEVLVNEVTRINDASVKVSGSILNTSLTTGYYIKTIALYANDPDEGEILYSITVANESDWMPPYNNVSSASILIDLITVVSNAENVTIDVNPNAIVTITQFNEFKDNVNTQLSHMTKKVISFVSVLEYGADRSGVNDSTQAFKDAIDYAKTTIVSSSFSNGVVVVIPSGIYKITDQIIIPPFVRIKTQGFVCISSSVANKSTLWITHQSGETTFYNMMLKQQYERSPIINASDGGMLIKSTLDKASGCIGLEIGSTSSLKDADNKNLSTSRYSLCDIAIENFDIGMQMNIYNHYIGTFDNLHLETNNTLVRFGKDGDTTVNNSGENFSFHGGVFASSTIGFDWYCDGFQCNFYGCSFDFITTLFNFRRGYKKVGIWGGHIEGITTIGDAINSSDTASLPQLYINNPQCFCDSLTLFKGLLKLICDNVKWTRSSSTQMSMYICDYNTIAKEICHISQGHDIALSPMLNKINNSKFQNIDISAGDVSAPFTGYTITSGGFNTSVVTSTIPTSSSYTRALKVVSISDTSWFQLATPNYSANPGDIIQIGIMYYTDATSINVKSKAIFYDVLGNTISSTGFYSDNANADLTKWNSSFNVPIVAPAGTEKVSIVYSISGVATGKTFYIGEIFLGIS